MKNVPLSAIGLNQQIYQRLKLSLGLNLRRQIFIAVCDDLNLRDRLAAQLQSEMSQSANPSSQPFDYPRLVSLQLSLEDPNPLMQIAQWLTQFPPPYAEGQRVPMPAFQIVGVEHLTRQSPAVQRLFFTHLQTIERNLPLLDFSLLIWMTQPWFHAISHSAPEFWRCRTGVFEFAGDPTPVIVTMPERFQTQSSGSGTGNGSFHSSKQNDLAKGASGQSISEQPIEAIESPVADLPSESGLGDSVLNEVFELDTHSATAELNDTELNDLDLDENPWALLEDEFGQLFEPDQPSHAPDSTLGSTESSTDLLDNERVAASTDDRTRDQNENLTETAPQSISLTDTVPIAPLALDLPHEVTNQPQLQVLLRQIERLYDQQAARSVLGEAYRTLGNFFRDRIEQGEATPQNLAVAIQIYEQSLLLLPEASPTSVDVLNDLGNLYWMLSRTLPNSNEALACLQQGVESYQQALTRIDPADKAHTYPMVQNNLGAAYADLARYQEPVANLERSIESYQQALRYRKPEIDPVRYASTQNNLGTTYWNLAQHQEPAKNLKQAIASYSEALRHYDPVQEPMNYAMIQNNLGTAYWNMSQHERPLDWLKLAVSAYEAALHYRTMATAPSAYAATQNNLGTAYWHIANQTEDSMEQFTCLKQAIAAYEAALQAAETLQQSQVLLNFDRFATHNNLGIAHYQVATESAHIVDTTAQSQHLQSALYHHVQAAQGWQGKDQLRQTAVSCIIQTVRACYHQLGMAEQNTALSRMPGHLLSEILPKL